MSLIADAFSPPKAKEPEPMPTRDTAVDEDSERKRRAMMGIGAGTAMLSGPGGVSTELTGTRQSYG